MIVNITQGSEAWAAWRAGGIGGSDAAILMGVDPKGRGPADLLKEKLEHRPFDFPGGQRLREPSRGALAFQQRTGIVVHPCCCQHDELDWLRATIEGITFLGDGVVKCGPRKVLDHECALAGLVPNAFVPQCQHTLLASGAELLWWVSWSVSKRFATEQRLAIVEVWPDAEYMAALVEVELGFWQRLCAAREEQVTSLART